MAQAGYVPHDQGQVSEDQQFRVESFEEKMVPKGGISVDASD